MPKKKHLHPLLEHPISAAIRAALSVPLLVGLDTSLSIARGLGELYPRLSPSRFQRAVVNLEQAFPNLSDDERRELAMRCYQHLFQIAVEILYAPRLITKEGYSRHLAFTHIESAVAHLLNKKPCILITGHCGNWELIGYAISMLGFPMHAVYRPLDLRPLDSWLFETRARRGLTLVSKFGAIRALPPVIKRGEPAGLVADQSGGDRGIFAPFFGRLTSTYKSIGLLAMQTQSRIVCGVARRLAPDEQPPPGNWQAMHDGGESFSPHGGKRDSSSTQRPPSMRYCVELIDEYGPEDWEKQPDPLFYLTARYRRAIETMVRRAPEQYFWMHRIWRSRPAHERRDKPFPDHLKEKLRALPWMTEDELGSIIERSERDRAEIRANPKASRKG